MMIVQSSPLCDKILSVNATWSVLQLKLSTDTWSYHSRFHAKIKDFASRPWPRNWFSNCR